MIAATDSAAPLIVLAAGGTGGHVFPAEALAQELLAQNFRLALITDRRGAAYGGTLGLIETYRVSARAVSGRGLVGLARGAAELAAGVVQAAGLLRRLAPAAVVGFGGYAAVPATAAALVLGLPTAIHEQNAVLGRANRLFARRAARVCTSFDLAKPAPAGATIVRTGMPVRAAVAAVRATPYVPPVEAGPFRIVVLGGSQGARVFSTIVPAAIARLAEPLRRRIEIAQQARPEDIDATHAAYAGAGVHVELRHFFDNVPELLAKAHLLIVRAGA
ncbi:MAG: glycosyltransferase, partial [Rhodospirillaceae bacterium]|nr:glycosyltransferase [Rhodospirillaceae bacterium]